MPKDIKINNGTLDTDDVLKFATSGAERMRIASNGNVGIGISDPAARLEVSNTIRVRYGGVNRYSEVTESSIKMYGGNDPQIIFADYNTGVDKLATIGFEDNYFGRGAIRFNVKGQANGAGIEAMRITSAGNVGIGTTTPGARLDVFGAQNSNYFRVSGDDASGGRALDFTSFTVAGSIGAGHQLNAKSLLGTLTFATHNTERMRIDSAGNVGVKATTFGTSAAAAFGIANGTEPSTSIADQIVMGSVDLTAGNTIPYVRSEGTGMTGAGITNTTVTHKIAIKVNGTVYYLLATTNGT